MRRDNLNLTSLQNKLHTLNDDSDLDVLINKIKDSKIVMLGEASHGTHEYYIWRAQISRRLIKEYGYNFIAVEGDWPACYKVNRFVKNYSDVGENVFQVLKGFNRWPTWMWANYEIAALCNWLRQNNKNKGIHKRIGFYGLDVYSLWESMEEIIKYLQKEDPEAAEVARQSFKCFEPYEGNEQQYAWATHVVPTSCEAEVLNMLDSILKRSNTYPTDIEATFSTEQNAFVTVNAENYYRSMIKPGPGSWNVRDHHMMETLNRLLNFHGPESKAIVWAHNTHIGDARFTDMHTDGMVNIGQLAREEYGEAQVKLVGFGSYEGNVIAGDSWGASYKKMQVPEAERGSWEQILKEIDIHQFYFLSEELSATSFYNYLIPHRAIGVVYHPDRERYGNYVPTAVGKRYDAFIFINRTEALHPIGINEDDSKIPETYPWNF